MGLRQEAKGQGSLGVYSAPIIMVKHQQNSKGFDYFPMNLKILSWDVRDLNEKDKRLQIKKFLRA